jgi:hypothetical protein
MSLPGCSWPRATLPKTRRPVTPCAAAAATSSRPRDRTRRPVGRSAGPAGRAAALDVISSEALLADIREALAELAVTDPPVLGKDEALRLIPGR